MGTGTPSKGTPTGQNNAQPGNPNFAPPSGAKNKEVEGHTYIVSSSGDVLGGGAGAKGGSSLVGSNISGGIVGGGGTGGSGMPPSGSGVSGAAAGTTSGGQSYNLDVAVTNEQERLRKKYGYAPNDTSYKNIAFNILTSETGSPISPMNRTKQQLDYYQSFSSPSLTAEGALRALAQAQQVGYYSGGKVASSAGPMPGRMESVVTALHARNLVPYGGGMGGQVVPNENVIKYGAEQLFERRSLGGYKAEGYQPFGKVNVKYEGGATQEEVFASPNYKEIIGKTQPGQLITITKTPAPPMTREEQAGYWKDIGVYERQQQIGDYKTYVEQTQNYNAALINETMVSDIPGIINIDYPLLNAGITNPKNIVESAPTTPSKPAPNFLLFNLENLYNLGENLVSNIGMPLSNYMEKGLRAQSSQQTSPLNLALKGGNRIFELGLDMVGGQPKYSDYTKQYFGITEKQFNELPVGMRVLASEKASAFNPYLPIGREEDIRSLESSDINQFKTSAYKSLTNLNSAIWEAEYYKTNNIPGTAGIYNEKGELITDIGTMKMMREQVKSDLATALGKLKDYYEGQIAYEKYKKSSWIPEIERGATSVYVNALVGTEAGLGVGGPIGGLFGGVIGGAWGLAAYYEAKQYGTAFERGTKPIYSWGLSKVSSDKGFNEAASSMLSNGTGLVVRFGGELMTPLSTSDVTQKTIGTGIALKTMYFTDNPYLLGERGPGPLKNIVFGSVRGPLGRIDALFYKGQPIVSSGPKGWGLGGAGIPSWAENADTSMLPYYPIGSEGGTELAKQIMFTSAEKSPGFLPMELERAKHAIAATTPLQYQQSMYRNPFDYSMAKNMEIFSEKYPVAAKNVQDLLTSLNTRGEVMFGIYTGGNLAKFAQMNPLDVAKLEELGQGTRDIDIKLIPTRYSGYTEADVKQWVIEAAKKGGATLKEDKTGLIFENQGKKIKLVDVMGNAKIEDYGGAWSPNTYQWGLDVGQGYIFINGKAVQPLSEGMVRAMSTTISFHKTHINPEHFRLKDIYRYDYGFPSLIQSAKSKPLSYLGGITAEREFELYKATRGEDITKPLMPEVKTSFTEQQLKFIELGKKYNMVLGGSGSVELYLNKQGYTLGRPIPDLDWYMRNPTQTKPINEKVFKDLESIYGSGINVEMMPGISDKFIYVNKEGMTIGELMKIRPNERITDIEGLKTVDFKRVVSDWKYSVKDSSPKAEKKRAQRIADIRTVEDALDWKASNLKMRGPKVEKYSEELIQGKYETIESIINRGIGKKFGIPYGELESVEAKPGFKIERKASLIGPMGALTGPGGKLVFYKGEPKPTMFINIIPDIFSIERYIRAGKLPNPLSIQKDVFYHELGHYKYTYPTSPLPKMMMEENAFKTKSIKTIFGNKIESNEFRRPSEDVIREYMAEWEVYRHGGLNTHSFSPSIAEYFEDFMTRNKQYVKTVFYPAREGVGQALKYKTFKPAPHLEDVSIVGRQTGLPIPSTISKSLTGKPIIDEGYKYHGYSRGPRYTYGFKIPTSYTGSVSSQGSKYAPSYNYNSYTASSYQQPYYPSSYKGSYEQKYNYQSYTPSYTSYTNYQSYTGYKGYNNYYPQYNTYNKYEPVNPYIPFNGFPAGGGLLSNMGRRSRRSQRFVPAYIPTGSMVFKFVGGMMSRPRKSKKKRRR